MPHGLGSSQVNAIASTAGTSTNKEDIYFIYYAPHTTVGGNAGGRNFDGFVLKAYKNAALDQAFAVDGDGVPQETPIADLQWVAPNWCWVFDYHLSKKRRYLSAFFYV